MSHSSLRKAVACRSLLLVVLCIAANVAFAAIDDFNGDGRSDVLWRNQATGANTVWRSASYASILPTSGVTNLAWNIAGTGDFNGDGRTDIAWRNTITGANVIWASANAAIQIPMSRLANLDWKVAGVGDFDGDGKSDALWRNTRTGANTIWLSGNSATVRAVSTLADLRWKVVGVGDFDGDGRSDVLWRHDTAGTNIAWKSASAATPMSLKSVAGTQWEVAGIGDFDNDNRSDILWRNVQTGADTIWKGGNSAALLAVSGVTNLAWRVAAVGDYGGDGSDDILWRHVENGSNAVWNSANASVATTLQSVTNLAWMVNYQPLTGAIAGESIGYLENSQLALAALDYALGAETGLSAEIASGPPMLVKLGAGNVLYFLSPREQYRDTTSVLILKNAGGTARWRLTFNWSSRVGTSLARIQEANESGQAPVDDSVTLSASGIGASGQVNASSVASYTLLNAPVVDPTLSEITFNSSSASIYVTNMFSFDPAQNRFTLTPAGAGAFRAAVQVSRKGTLTFSFSSAGRAQSFGFEQSLRYANGSLALSVVNSDGTPATSLAGTQFVLRGVNSGTTALGSLGGDARMSFVNLPSDTYEVSQVLLGPGTRLLGLSALPTPDTVASLVISRPPATAVLATGSYVASKSQILNRPGFFPTSQGRRAGVARARASAAVSSQIYTVSASSSTQGSLITTPVDFTTPSGTTQVKVQVDVATQEYPSYTQQNSQFNDAWQFNLQFPSPIPAMEQSGTVNQTHSNSGIISFKQCITLTAAQQTGGFRITGILGAMNVADSALATTVTVTIASQCDALTVTEFSGTTRTPDQLYALTPKKLAGEKSPNGNLDGQYLSMPRAATLPSAFGLPSLLRYSPSSLVVEQVELFQRTTGSPDISLGINYLVQGDATTRGLVRFAGLRINPMVVPLVGDGRSIQIMAVVRGRVGGGTLLSSDAVPLMIDERYSQFTPLYLTSELPGYSSTNRYGIHSESGGDNWATLSMAEWVMGAGLRYDDLSAASVKQTGPDKYRSVLRHAGHSDGQQADLRYWDGSGGHTDTLGGANFGKGLADLAAAALVEVNNGAVAKPKLTALVAWINENRSSLDAYALLPEVRSIFVGQGHVSRLLIDGKFPGTNTAITGISPTKWDKRAKITAQPDHLNHWHVNTVN